MKILINLFGVKKEFHVKENRAKVENLPQIPSINDFARFKKWLLGKVKDIERLLN
jgi:hypothetical protein